MTWISWKPEFNDSKRLSDVLASMPRDNADKIPWQVWLLENPDSPIAFPGAISLYRHDCMHALLCASFHAEDEAFTVGFTMGTCEWGYRWYLRFFMWLTTWFYPGEYRWNNEYLKHFLDGFKKGQESGMYNLNEFPFEDYENLSLKDLRNLVGIEWMDSTISYREWSQRWKINQFEEPENQKNEKPKPGKNPITFALRRVFARK